MFNPVILSPESNIEWEASGDSLDDISLGKDVNNMKEWLNALMQHY